MNNIQGRRESLSKEDAFHLDPDVVHRFNLLNLHHQSSPPPNSVAARRYKRLKRCRTCGGSLKKASGGATDDKTTSRINTSSSPSFRRTAVHNCSCKLLNTTTELKLNDTNQVSNCGTTGNFKNFDNLLSGSNSQVPPIAASSIPPVPLPLFTSFSNPISPDHQQVEFTTPQSSNQEKPNSKKLRKFKQRMEEMKQWMGKVMQEEDEDSDIINHCKEQAESENEESVCVKKTDKGSILNFKCPCGGGYEVFLCGDKCFYRLT